MMHRICLGITVCLALLTPDRQLPAETFPYRQPPIRYFDDDLTDPVSGLQNRLQSGKVTLKFDPGPRGGYLQALLDALEINPASQMLVFARNSVHARFISPENPRALYFNDNVYVGYVPGAPFLEISSVDPSKGAIFYTLAQKEQGPPVLTREDSCLLCHASSNALNVPGHLVRSFLTDPQGNPSRGHSRINHNSPFAQRWGGFYVTGDWGTLSHQGNLSSAADLLDYERHPDGPGRTAKLTRRFDPNRYLTPHSDLIALMVHDHQTHGHNLLTRVRYEHAFPNEEQPDRNSEQDLVRYLLFVDEPPLENPVLGSTDFERSFAALGPRDTSGRSLRQFDLESRLFKYRLSYLIYSPAFDSLPDPVRNRVYRRLWEILSAATPEAPFDKLPQAERTAIREIVAATKRDLPREWQAAQP